MGFRALILGFREGWGMRGHFSSHTDRCKFRVFKGFRILGGFRALRGLAEAHLQVHSLQVGGFYSTT